jgi:hypothetical protein
MMRDETTDEMMFDDLEDAPVEVDPLGDRVGWGYAYVDGKRLEFWLAVDEAALLAQLGVELPPRPAIRDTQDFTRWWNAQRVVVAEAIESFARATSSDARVRVAIDWGGPTTAGPGGVAGTLIDFLLNDGGIEKLAALLYLGEMGWRQIATAVRTTSGRHAGVSDGFAVIEASRRVESEFGSTVTEIVDVIPLYPNNLDRMGTPEGYTVMLRDETALYTVTVSYEGAAVGVSRTTLSGLTQPWPERSNDENVDLDAAGGSGGVQG